MTSVKNHTIVAKKITDDFIDIIAGRSEEALFGYKPSDVVMLGMIKAGQVIPAMDEIDSVEVVDFKSVASIGLSFRVNNNTRSIKISIKGKLYYRVVPTYAEQTKYILLKYSKKYGRKFININELNDFLNNLKISDPDFVYDDEIVVFKYKSIELSDYLKNIVFDLSNVEYSTIKLNELVRDSVQEIKKKIKDFSVSISGTERSINHYFDENEFNLLLNSSTSNSIPLWSIRIITKENQIDLNTREISIQLINETPKISDVDGYDTSIYDSGFIINNEEYFEPIKLKAIKHEYYSSQDIFGLGINCSVIDDNVRLETSNIPTYYQKRIKTIDSYNDIIEFEKMVLNPVENLNIIKNELLHELSKYKADLEICKKNKSDFYIKNYSDDIKKFEDEIQRFSYGIYLIENKAIVRESFKYMNETFSMNGKYKNWRLFQIVFIVSEISDIVYSQFEGNSWYDNYNIDNVDMIYFSTGGGKTETFLGCVMFAMFFDRLRGKNCGTTAFIKYPLRLLTVQQLDRILYLIMNGNLILDKYKLSGDSFSVGLLIGKEVTPNRINDAMAKNYKTYDQLSLDTALRKIDYCPKCKSEVHIVFNEKAWELQHICSNCGKLPVSIIDDEIYRNPNSIIVSSIDKMAAIGIFPGFKTIFGQNSGKCSKHGFVWGEKNKCNCPGCNNPIGEKVILKDPVPTLFIQDELHLLNESLGTYDSHYETFINYYCSKLLPEDQRKKIKYIGATATIAEFEDHCLNLYNKNGRCFPISIKGKNFYSYESDELNRIIMGAALYGGSITVSIEKAVTQIRAYIEERINNVNLYYNDFINAGFSGTIDELKGILNDYLITIIYNTSKMDSNNLQTTLQNQGDNYLNENGYQKYIIGNISGDEDFTKIKDIMHEIGIENDKLKTPNLILATSAISHGVDEDSFNQIFFYGMPNKTSEYIQSYSRVGRKYTGIVFDVIRMARDRDRSYLKNFISFHRNKDLLIEPVPINRWAKTAVYSTLPGIIAAILMQYYNCDYYACTATKKIKNGTITFYDIKNILLGAYGCLNGGPETIIYAEIIENESEHIFTALQNYTGTDRFLSDVIASGSSYKNGPMPSLRDVDVMLEVKLVEK